MIETSTADNLKLEQVKIPATEHPLDQHGGHGAGHLEGEVA